MFNKVLRFISVHPLNSQPLLKSDDVPTFHVFLSSKKKHMGDYQSFYSYPSIAIPGLLEFMSYWQDQRLQMVLEGNSWYFTQTNRAVLGLAIFHASVYIWICFPGNCVLPTGKSSCYRIVKTIKTHQLGKVLFEKHGTQGKQIQVYVGGCHS